ncbi:MAG: tail fiber protein [Reinekea sp.]
MADPFLGEIRQVPYSFSPRGFAYCSGEILPIVGHEALYSIIGTHFGGDGRYNMALPNLEGRSVMHSGQGRGLKQHPFAEDLGFCHIPLLTSQIPSHNHSVVAVKAPPSAVNDTTKGSYLSTALIEDSSGKRGAMSVYSLEDGGENLVDLNNQTVGIAGRGGGHENRQPYIAIPFCIALDGIYPARN